MRLAEVVRAKPPHIEIPRAFQQPLELRPGSAVYVYPTHDDSKQKFIITTIPYRFWDRIVRVSCLLRHRAGALHKVCDIIREPKIGGNILIMEGSGHEGFTDSWWSGVVHFPLARDRTELPRFVSELLSRLKETYEQGLDLDGRDVWPFAESFLEEGTKRLQTPRPVELVAERGLRLVEAAGSTRPYPVTVEPMRLAELVDEVIEDAREKPAVPFGRGRVSEASYTSRYQQGMGLLVCDTEEKFIRFLDTAVPVVIDLPIVTRGSEQTVGVGALEKLTQVLNQNKANLIHTYNYLIERSPIGVEDAVEKAYVRFVVQADHEANLKPREVFRPWEERFQELITARREGDQQDLVIDKAAARLRIWHRNELRVFRGTGDDRVRRMGFLGRLIDRRERARLPWLRFQMAKIAMIGLTAFALFWVSLEPVVSYFENLEPRELAVATTLFALLGTVVSKLVDRLLPRDPGG